MKPLDKDDEIARTLRSLDDLHPASVPPFFYTKLKARMERERSRNSIPFLAIFGKPVVSFAVMLIFIFLNAFAIFNTWQSAAKASNKTSIDDFSTEYNLSVYTVYDDKKDQ